MFTQSNEPDESGVVRGAEAPSEAKWLFMSATPAHGGPGDLPRILNHYPQSGEILDPNFVHCLPAMQEALRAFLVRRPAPLSYEEGPHRIR